MYLLSISLQNFRNYIKSRFDFRQRITIIIGPNTSGKTNLIEAIYYLAFGKSSRLEGNEDSIRIGEETARISGETDTTELEAVLVHKELAGKDIFRKRYLINGVSKRRIDFMGHLFCVLFSPTDIEIVIGSPYKRRGFLNEVLSQTDRDYRLAEIAFEKGLRQRNALLQRTKESGARQNKEFAYWDNLLIENGSVIAKKRERFIRFINDSVKDVFDFIVDYDKSLISQERLLQYRDAEVGAGVTLVGPHRDDMFISMLDVKGKARDLKVFGSRGQQRLVVLELKLLQLLYMEGKLGFKPLLLLDDIFSELDTKHIELVSKQVIKQQTIITTTHREFLSKEIFKNAKIINIDGLNNSLL